MLKAPNWLTMPRRPRASLLRPMPSSFAPVRGWVWIAASERSGAPTLESGRRLRKCEWTLARCRIRAGLRTMRMEAICLLHLASGRSATDYSGLTRTRILVVALQLLRQRVGALSHRTPPRVVLAVHVYAQKPHDGYRLMMKWGAQKKHPAFSFTSNIDGHWLDAGMPADHVTECHGMARAAHVTVSALNRTHAQDRFAFGSVVTGARTDARRASPFGPTRSTSPWMRRPIALFLRSPYAPTAASV